jgi:hypothetical protein
MGFALVIGFTGLLKLVTTGDYNHVTNFTQFTIYCAARSKSSVFTMHWLVTVSHLTHGSKCVLTFSNNSHFWFHYIASEWTPQKTLPTAFPLFLCA